MCIVKEGGVAEPFADDLDRHAGHDEQRRVRVGRSWKRTLGSPDLRTTRSKTWVTDSGFRNRPVCRTSSRRRGGGGRRCATVDATGRVRGGFLRRGRRAAAGAGLDAELDGSSADVLQGAGIDSRARARSRSDHLRPTTSPRRMPVWAARWSAG